MIGKRNTGLAEARSAAASRLKDKNISVAEHCSVYSCQVTHTANRSNGFIIIVFDTNKD
jgi:hypothetical protein